ncbi:MAG: carboxypeptidase regulatory-like domain-containing protein, partial [Thermoplasmata archaeon]|nr:carboxypeptidase regulatory-like domain-containing protein [Thermoplasmata archaeon]
SDGCVGGWMRSKGINILENEGVYYLIAKDYLPAENREYYIIPSDVTDITLELTGRTDGTYTVSFTSIKDCTSKRFEMTTTGSMATTDTFVFSESELGLREMEPDKTYDLTITYVNTATGVTTKFRAVDIKTSDEDQGFEVTEWENLGDEKKKPVTFYEGDREKRLKIYLPGTDLREGKRFTVIIRDQENDLPVEGAEVKVLKDGGVVKNGTTNSDGEITFSLDYGIYTIRAEKTDYTSAEKQITVKESDEEEHEKGFIPGFGVVSFSVGILAAMVLWGRKRERK